MSQLNNAMMREVRSKLNSSSFTADDFQISFPASGNTLLQLTFIGAPTYSYVVTRQEKYNSDEIAYVVTACPGAHLKIERFSTSEIPRTIASIPTWCQNLRHDLRLSSPVYDELSELRESLLNQINEHVSDPEKHFTRDEAESLTRRFDEILEQFGELKKKNKITEDELAAVKADLKALKENAQSFPKGVFFRTAGNKILSMICSLAKSPEGKHLLLSTAKHLVSDQNGSLLQ